jgi:hypothetical protein
MSRCRSASACRWTTKCRWRGPSAACISCRMCEGALKLPRAQQIECLLNKQCYSAPQGRSWPHLREQPVMVASVT